MSTDLTELDGVAEGRAENLTEAGYESVEDLVDADAGEISEEVSYLPEDTALELIVQAQNIVAEEDAEVEESQPSITEEVEEAVEEETSDDEESEPDPITEEDVAEGEGVPLSEEEREEQESENEPEPEDEEFDFSIAFETGLEYDTFFDAVMGQRSKMLRSNRSGVEAFDHALEQMRDGGMDEPVELTMTEQELNDLHNSVRQTTIEYKGDNLIDHMDALNSVLADINEVRDEYLF